MVMLQVVVVFMVGVTVMAMFYRHALGGAKESVILALGKVPNTEILAQKLIHFGTSLKDLPHLEMVRLLENLSIYDLRMTHNVMTAVGAEIGDASLMIASRVSLMSQSSRKSLDSLRKEREAEPGVDSEGKQPQEQAHEIAEADEKPTRPWGDDAPPQTEWL
ncbi:GABBR2 [Symbiodinium microadriaticum]|nr:GABBR2 [Symbiodinium microadriaticum]